MAACRRHSCLFGSHITSIHHISNIETPCPHGPDVGFNTYNEMRACGAGSSCRAAVNTYIVSACVFCSDLRVLTCGLVLRPMRRPHEHRATSSYRTCILVLVLALSRLMPSKVEFETHIRGITTYQNPSFPMKALDSTSTRSKHKWYWYQGTKNQPFPMSLDFARTNSKHTWHYDISKRIKTSHYLCRPSIPQVRSRHTYVASLLFSGIPSCTLGRCDLD